MAWALAEGIIDEIIAHLTSDLPAKLDLLDIEYSDSIILADVRNYFRKDPEAPGIAVMAPEVFVLGLQSDMAGWRQTTIQAEHDIVVWLVTQDVDTETLRKLVYRYGRAIFEVLVAGHFDSSITWNMIGTPQIDFSPISSRGTAAMADVRVSAQFTKLETA